MRIRPWAIAATAVSALALSACSSPSSTLSPADNFVIDCQAASASIGSYGTNLQALVTALTSGDATAASAAADGFEASAKQVVDSLPGLPPEAQGFIQVSQKFTERVKDAVSSKNDLPSLAVEAKTTFAEQEFTSGADAVEAFFRQQCPAQAANQG